MKNYILPPLVLTIICTIISGLLVLAYNKTYVDTTGVLTDELKGGCENIFGEGDYSILINDKTELPENFNDDSVKSIIVEGKGNKCLFEIEQDGYAKKGLHLLIGIDSVGSVSGIYFLDIGETPGVGTKVQEKSFLDKLIGFSKKTDINSIDNITSATYSSEGMKTACKKAVTLYSEHKEEIYGDKNK